MREGTYEPAVAHNIQFYNFITASATVRVAGQHEAGSSEQLVLKPPCNRKAVAGGLWCRWRDLNPHDIATNGF